MNKKPVFNVVLRRANRRFVKEAQRPSRYSAKKLAARWEEIYDPSYYVEIEDDQARDDGDMDAMRSVFGDG